MQPATLRKQHLRAVFIVMACMCLFSLAAGAQADTVVPGNHRLIISALKPGLRQYLVYFQNPQTPKQLQYFWFWMRDVRLETKNNEPVFAIRQCWLGSDTNAYRAVYSLNSAKDFAPLYHSETARNKINAFNWSPRGIVSADTVDGNARKDFRLDFAAPNFNWNLDIETFEMLPLAAGKAFAIHFYDAGSDIPKYVLYKVTGSELITTLNNEQVDCWKLYTEGESRGTKYSETFWISKKEHELLKEEDAFGGGFRYKVKLPGLAPDLLKRFN